MWRWTNQRARYLGQRSFRWKSNCAEFQILGTPTHRTDCSAWTTKSLQMSYVARSASLCVVHTGELCKNGWTDRDAVCMADSSGPKEYYLRRGSAADESIWRREGWQEGDASFCQITLDTCSELVERAGASVALNAPVLLMTSVHV